MIKGTVALPIWNSAKIAWLCMESLCRQNIPQDGWELIVYEELHPGQVGEAWIRKYEERLKMAGCERVVYLTRPDKISLSEKWVFIAREASKSSIYYCLCAADNYYHPEMLRTAEVVLRSYDWCVQDRGYFYSFLYDRVLYYQFVAPIGLQMYAKTDFVRKFTPEILSRGIDSWFERQMEKEAVKHFRLLKLKFDETDDWRGTLCTDGLNNISYSRKHYFTNPQHPFYPTDAKLLDIVPEDVAFRINVVTECVRSVSL